MMHGVINRNKLKSNTSPELIGNKSIQATASTKLQHSFILKQSREVSDKIAPVYGSRPYYLNYYA